MTTNTELNLEKLSFSEAIAATQQWLQRVEGSELTKEQIFTDLKTLLGYANGVRGFFVAYLTGESILADQPPAVFIEGFRATSSSIKAILIKNLAMSTAMGITHSRNNNAAQQAGSQRVQRRSINLLQLLAEGENAADFIGERMALVQAIATKEGEYHAFLNRWQYDDEQRQAIRVVFESL